MRERREVENLGRNMRLHVAVALSLLALAALAVAPAAGASTGVCSVAVTGSGLTSSRFERQVVPVTLAGTTTIEEFVAGEDGIYARLLVSGQLTDSQGRVLHEFVDKVLYGGSAMPVTDIHVDPTTGDLVVSFGRSAVRPQSWFITVEPSPLVVSVEDAGRTAGLVRAIGNSLASGTVTPTVTLLNLLCARA